MPWNWIFYILCPGLIFYLHSSFFVIIKLAKEKLCDLIYTNIMENMLTLAMKAYVHWQSSCLLGDTCEVVWWSNATSIDNILIVLTSPQRGGSVYVHRQHSNRLNVASTRRQYVCGQWPSGLVSPPPPPGRPYCLSLIFMLAHLKSQRNPSVFNLLDLVPTLFITIYFILNNL